jgi:hypothetical protein
MNKSRPIVLLLGLQALVGGCDSSPTATATSPPPPHPWTSPLSPDEVKEWSPQEAKAVLVAWAAVMRESKQAGGHAPDIMKFVVKPVPTGWEVFVQYVGVYVDGKPMPAPSYFAVVEIDPNWRVIRIVGGA